jgi:hypothetical protein
MKIAPDMTTTLNEPKCAGIFVVRTDSGQVLEETDSVRRAVMVLSRYAAVNKTSAAIYLRTLRGWVQYCTVFGASLCSQLG